VPGAESRRFPKPVYPVSSSIMKLPTLDKDRCIKCGRCISLFGGYCMSDDDGYPVFDAAICNLCQKCVAICPSQAIMVNGIYPDRIPDTSAISPEQLVDLLERRRSTKLFRAEPIARETLDAIAAVAKFAPNQNKNIAVHVVDDPDLLRLIDRSALRFVRVLRRFLGTLRPVSWLVNLFTDELPRIRKKVERDLSNGYAMKKNSQAAVILTGDKRVPVTEHSAPCLMATMILMAEALGVGTCLMDSLLLALRIDRRLRRTLKISDDVLGVMVLGYSAEGVVNIPRGYEVEVTWNNGDS
jgi:nitroreductase/Pyruvate/2-oxoacid:ferredoxin oxidoreductase delta subunit